MNIFKFHELRSLPESEIALTLTSSGTQGQRSQVWFDRASLDRGLAMVDSVFSALGFKQPELEVNYLLFAHEPRPDNKRGTTFTDENLTKLTKRREVVFALRWDERLGDFAFDVDAVLATLQRFATSGYQTRLLGFPSFLHFALTEHQCRGGKPFAFHGGCYVITGGGWKTHSDKAVPKEILRREIAEVLGIPAANIRDSFGMVEHGIPYVECPQHHMHVPVYAEASIRHLSSLERLPYGQKGLLQLDSPFNLAMPTLSILTSDFAVMGEHCPCGIARPYFEIIGRAGTTKAKGCAISALELLSRQRR